jgi:protein-tyrosine phosphatase
MSAAHSFTVDQALPRPIPESYWVISGRLLAGEYPGAKAAPERTRQRLDAFLAAGINTFINLTEAGELEDYTPFLQEHAAAQQVALECLRFPIVDVGLPTRAGMCAILDAIDVALAQERRVYVHCFGGIGRTGTVVGCFLVRHGRSGAQALQELAGWWRGVPKSARSPYSPETRQQEQFVLNWS